MREMIISESIGNINQKYVNEATNYVNQSKTVHKSVLVKFGALAACVALVAILGIGVFQSGILGNNTHTVTLENGETLNFVKTDFGLGQLDTVFSPHELNADDLKALFGNLPVTAFAYFDEEEKMVGLEGNLGDIKLIISKSGMNLNDTPVIGEENVSKIQGIPVTAGYCVANNQGHKVYIYYAAFELGDNTVYVENAGASDEIEKVQNDLVSAIKDLIDNGELDFSQITK